MSKVAMISALVLVVFLDQAVRAAESGASALAPTDLAMSAAENLPTTRWSAEKLRELSRNINSLPDEIAAEGLWLVASAPPRVDTLSIYANALTAPSEKVRAITASILASQNTDDARRLLMNTLALERDPGVVQAVVSGLAHLPRARAVRGLMDVMFLSGVTAMATDSAAEELRRLTRADVGNSPADWRDWWLDNESSYD